MKILALLVIAVALGHASSAPMIDLCKTCIDFAGQFINQLLNIVLNVGVVGGCADLCGILENKTHSQAAGVACNLLCDVVGIKEFINIIEKADLDPIYYCELLKTCTVKDDGDAKINSVTVSPPSVPRGSRFNIVMNYTTVKGTGTGEYSVLIRTVDGIPLGQSYLTEPQQPGTYIIKWDVSAKPDPDCDPTQGPCENWLPGNYTASVAICNGECGSSHPHSQVYDTLSTNFTVTELMECVCFESVCGRRCCKINLSKTTSFGSIAASQWTWITLLLLFMVYVVWPGQWLWICILSLLTLSYTAYKLLPASEDLLAVSGVGMYISNSIGPFTSTSLFIPQTATRDVIVYEVISKYHIHFSLGLYLHSPSSQPATILVPLFKTYSSLSLEDLQVAYKHLKDILQDKTEHKVYFR